MPGVTTLQTSRRIVFSADDGFRPVFLSRSTRSFVPSGVSVCSTRATLWPLATRASTYLP